MSSPFIYTTQTIRELEKLAIANAISSDELMLRAATAAFQYLLQHFPQHKQIAVFCGTGNNGGDGYVLARLMHEHGLQVQVYQVGDHANLKNEAKNAYTLCQQAAVPIFLTNEKTDWTSIDLIVDAICGIGAHEMLRDPVLSIVNKINELTIPVFALDIPTGIDSDTGCVLGVAIRAELTMTFIGLKIGLMTGAGTAYAGKVVCHDLQLPAELFAQVTPSAEKIVLANYASYLKPRPRDWHKGLSGHVLIIGGDKGYSGAAVMAAEAALRVGAGLVSVATHPDNAAMMNVSCPEIMCHSVTTVEELKPLLSKASAIIVGPGLGQSEWAENLWREALQQKKPLVVDADGLNLLANHIQQNKHWILTPHPGEAARLLKTSTEAIQQDRFFAVEAMQEKYHGVCVLKGAGSLLFAGGKPLICDLGNPGMSSAGMGDILSGVLGGLLAQGIPLLEAAAIGVYVHAAAGDLAAKAGERGTIATDLLPHLRTLVNGSEDA